MNFDKKTFFVRTAVILFYAVCIIFSIVLLIENPLKNDFYGNLIHDESLFHCPSCGLTRAWYCLMTFKFKEAFYYHAYFTILLPVILYIVLTTSVNVFFNKKIIPYPKRYSIFLYALFGILIAFTIFRNFTSVIY